MTSTRHRLPRDMLLPSSATLWPPREMGYTLMIFQSEVDHK